MVTILSQSQFAALVGHALNHAVLGLLFALSLLTPRPLIQPLARQAIAGTDKEQQMRFDQRARHPATQRLFRITAIWALSLFAVTGILLVAIFVLPARDYLLASPIISFGVLGLLIFGSIIYSRRRMTAAGVR